MTIQKYRTGDLVRILPFDEIDLEDVGGYYSHNMCFGLPRITIDEYALNMKGIALAVCSVHELPNGTKFYSLRVNNCADTSLNFGWAQGMIAPFVEDKEDEPLCDADPDSLMHFLMA